MKVKKKKKRVKSLEKQWSFSFLNAYRSDTVTCLWAVAPGNCFTIWSHAAFTWNLAARRRKRKKERKEWKKRPFFVVSIVHPLMNLKYHSFSNKNNKKNTLRLEAIKTKISKEKQLFYLLLLILLVVSHY